MCVQCYEVAGEKQRFKILSLLKEQKELCVADVADALKVRQPTATHHLKLLLDVGLVRVEQRGKERWYSLDKESECFSECGMLNGLLPKRNRA
jgi:DNA-binding transcriptional ArsR family regulator